MTWVEAALDDVVLPSDLAWLAPRDELTERAPTLMERTAVSAGTDLDQRPIDVRAWLIEQDQRVGRLHAAS